MAMYTHYEVANSPADPWREVMGTSYTLSSSVITIFNTDGTLTKAHGGFLVFNGQLLGGLVTSMQRTSANGQIVYEDIAGITRDANAFLNDYPSGRIYFALGGEDQLYGHSGNDYLEGGHDDDLLIGGAGDDKLRGGDGNDKMIGGTGNDTYWADSSEDTIIEAVDGGIDTVIADWGVTLAANVENMLVDSDYVTAYGNDDDNMITIESSDSTVEGRGGDDTFDVKGSWNKVLGGLGDDTFYITSGSEAFELADQGHDTVHTNADHVWLGDNIEDLTFWGPGKHFGYGNDLDNYLYMLSGDSAHLEGRGGNDTLWASGGDDTIDGGEGDDKIYSTWGSDTIIGGEGDDTYVTIGGQLSDYKMFDRGDKIFISVETDQDTLTGIEHIYVAGRTIDPNDGNPVFDTIYYLTHNPDVFYSGMNALDHYNVVGWHEGRDPNAWFDTSGYLAVNKDVAASGMNPLDHYHQTGWHEGRDPGANFDTTLYLIHNPDVAAAGIDPLAHYLASGMAEGRQAYQAIGQNIAGGFDAQHYLFHNPDVAAAGIDPLSHFNAVGWKEGRDPNAWFDSDGYLAYYTDVKAAGINPLQHYETIGWKEGRDPSAGFDTAGYLATYTDVAAAGINPLDHFLQVGIYEGRHAVNDGMWG